MHPVHWYPVFINLHDLDIKRLTQKFTHSFYSETSALTYWENFLESSYNILCWIITALEGCMWFSVEGSSPLLFLFHSMHKDIRSSCVSWEIQLNLRSRVVSAGLDCLTMGEGQGVNITRYASAAGEVKQATNPEMYSTSVDLHGKIQADDPFAHKQGYGCLESASVLSPLTSRPPYLHLWAW